MTSDPVDSRVAAAQERAQRRAARYHEQLREVARAAGGRLAGDDGTDVEHSVKDVESMDHKAGFGARRGQPIGEALLDIRDMNRYTILFGEQDYTAGVERVQELMAERGFTWDYGKNTWDDPFYKGYNTWFRDQSQAHAALDPQSGGEAAEHHPVEVQFHTPESFAAKSENHDLYKLVRSGGLSYREKAAANDLQARRNERVPEPPGYERLADRIPPAERLKDLPEQDLERVRQRDAVLSERVAERGEPARAPPGRGSAPPAVPRQPGPADRSESGLPAPPAGELRRLAPERSTGGKRGDAGDEEIDRKGLER